MDESLKMWGRLVSKLAVWAVKNKRLSGEDKARVTNALYDNLQAIPLRNIITFNGEGTVLINGRKMTMEQSMAFVESARALKDSYARKMIHEQVLYEAVKMGIHQGLTPEMIQFSKAAIWYAQEENKLLNKIIPDIFEDNQ